VPDPHSDLRTTETQRWATPGFVGHARLVGALTLLSRISGLIRDAVCARAFGAGPVWSAFAFAFLLPNLFRRLFGEGALSAAFLPEYARLVQSDPKLAGRVLLAAVVGVAAILGGVVLLGEAVILALKVATPLGDTGGLALSLAMIMLPYMILICGVALLGAALQCHGRFGPTAAAPVILNAAIILAAMTSVFWLGLETQEAILFVAFSVLAAGVAQLGLSALALRTHQRWPTEIRGVAPAIRRIGAQLGPAAIGLGALQINTLFDGFVASWPVLIGPSIPLPESLGGAVDYPMDGASNAVLFFAQRLYQFPLGVFGLALATAVFPLLARTASDNAVFNERLRASLRIGFFIGLPATVGLALVREPLAALLYEGGEFGADATARVAAALLGYAPAVWAATLAHLLNRALYARGFTAASMRIALVAIAINVAASLSLMWTLREAALAWATSISVGAQVVMLLSTVRRRLGARCLTPLTLGSARRSALLTAAMAAATLGAGWAAGDDGAPASDAVRLVAMVGAGMTVYFAGATAFRMPELRWLTRRDGPA